MELCTHMDGLIGRMACEGQPQQAFWLPTANAQAAMLYLYRTCTAHYSTFIMYC